MRVDLVGHDPETLAPRDVENGAQIIKRRGPTGRIGGRVDEDAARFRADRAFQFVEIELPGAAGKFQLQRLAIAPGDFEAAEMFGQEGVR